MAVERSIKRRRLSPNTEANGSLPGFAKWDLEQDYEQRPRKNKKKEDSNRLPVKSQEHGRWEQDTSRPQEDVNDEVEHFSDSENEHDNQVETVSKPAAPVKPQLPPKEELRQAKEDLARIASQLSENPEENISLLSSLGQLAGSANLTVKKLALATQCAVYQDIIPGYRIRPLAKDDLGAKISKDVRKVRAFEQGLLTGYKEYIDLLSGLAASKDGDAAVASVALSCAANLLKSVAHFNFRNEVLNIIVRKLSSRNIDADWSKCQAALETLFREDGDGHASLEAVGLLTKMIKGRNFNVHQNVVHTFLQLRLLGEFVHTASTSAISKKENESNGPTLKRPKKKEFMTKRARKLTRERKEVEKEMREADAVVSYEERDKNQAETLKLVFVSYFRILKARTPHLMSAVLEGLAKYAHLINQDFFGDVLEALKDLMRGQITQPAREDDNTEDTDVDVEEPNRNATRETLLCIITAFALLQGQNDVAKSAKTLHLDLGFFTTELYRLLLPWSVNTDIESTTQSGNPAEITLLLRALSFALLTQPPPPPQLLATFVKNLLTTSLHLPHASALAVLNLLKQVLKSHGARISSLWNAEERKGDGVFNPLSESVEGSNVFASTVWEGEVLRLHFDPKIREAVRGIEALAAGKE